MILSCSNVVLCGAKWTRLTFHSTTRQLRYIGIYYNIMEVPIDIIPGSNHNNNIIIIIHRAQYYKILFFVLLSTFCNARARFPSTFYAILKFTSEKNKYGLR